MAKNRTAIDVFSAIGSEIMVLLLVVLAACLTVSRYMSVARARVRRVEATLRRRAARRMAA